MAEDPTGAASDTDFLGAKAAILIGDRLLITQRDDRPDIPFPGLWDLPGGGREAAESPHQVMIRETREEVGLDLSDIPVLWARRYAMVGRPGWVWFFVLALPAGAEAGIAFGDEGQGWRLIAPGDFLTLPDAVPHLRDRLRDWMNGVPGEDTGNPGFRSGAGTAREGA